MLDFGLVVDLFWNSFNVFFARFGPFRGRFWIDLGPILVRFLIDVEPVLGRFGVDFLVASWDHLERFLTLSRGLPPRGGSLWFRILVDLGLFFGRSFGII